MKNYLLPAVIFFMAVSLGFAAGSMAAGQNWEQEFRDALVKAKQAGQAAEPDQKAEVEERLLDEAIQNAMDQGGPGCQILKMAVEAGFNPYPALLSIYSRGEVDLDEVCMCATEQGVSTAVIAQAATNAAGPEGESAYSRDEIAQCQCLQAGLPYTVGENPPPPPPPPPPVPPDSASAP